ncbi:MAG: MjaI family restriction endonuclease [Thermoproteota archaeon]|nr:MjaI family restriction endonuclease [Thermoproteota archaeon]
MELIIKNSRITQDIAGKITEFPKYTSQLMNLANQNAQGTRPKVVGQLSDLIQECPKKTYKEWVNWYNEKMPTAIDDATEKVYEMIQNLNNAIKQIDKDLVKKWVEDLVLTKTFVGLCFQESILKVIAERRLVNYRLATPIEESQNIDGYIGDIPVSIKPITYKTKNMLHENINVKIIYYEKLKDGIKVEYHF